MIRAVVDANVLVSAFISPHSHPREIVRCWRSGQFVLVTSRAIVEEVDRVLHRPRILLRYGLAEVHIHAFVLTLVHAGECVPDTPDLRGVAPDPGDDKVIACAVGGRARYIVTGDKALQGINEYQGIRIVGAEQFVRLLGE